MPSNDEYQHRQFWDSVSMYSIKQDYESGVVPVKVAIEKIKRDIKTSSVNSEYKLKTNKT